MSLATEFTVCGTCFHLYGESRGRRQLCSCSTAEEREAHRDEVFRRTGDHWTKLATLCHCCGAEVLDASHKFSQWFCPPCLELAKEVNLALGTCAIPIGWHSVVNGVFFHVNRCKTLPGATAVADQLGAFFEDTGSQIDWATGVVEHHWHRSGLPAGLDVTVEHYLEAVRSAGVDKDRLFSDLAAARGVPADWRDFEAVPLELVWVERHDAFGVYLEAHEHIVWRYPDGEYDDADLVLKVAEGHEGAAFWGVILDGQAAGDSYPVLANGMAVTEEEAKAACEAAALRLIEEHEHDGEDPA